MTDGSARAKGKRTTIYVSGELLDLARMLHLNISAICQAALSTEIEMQMDQLHAAIDTGRTAEQLLARLNGTGDLPNGA